MNIGKVKEICKGFGLGYEALKEAPTRDIANGVTMTKLGYRYMLMYGVNGKNKGKNFTIGDIKESITKMDNFILLEARRDESKTDIRIVLLFKDRRIETTFSVPIDPITCLKRFYMQVPTDTGRRNIIFYDSIVIDNKTVPNPMVSIYITGYDDSDRYQIKVLDHRDMIVSDLQVKNYRVNPVKPLSYVKNGFGTEIQK